MSFEEYNDLYLKSQKNINAPYLCFSFDLVDSKKLDNENMYKQQILMIKTMKDVITKLQELEHITNKRILLSDKNIKINIDVTNNNATHAYCNNPCILAGDFYAFYVYNKSITESDFLNIFTNCAINNKLLFSYHYQSAKFETTEYQKGCDKYYIGYCVGYLQHNKGNSTIKISNDNEQNLNLL